MGAGERREKTGGEAQVAVEKQQRLVVRRAGGDAPGDDVPRGIHVAAVAVVAGERDHVVRAECRPQFAGPRAVDVDDIYMEHAVEALRRRRERAHGPQCLGLGMKIEQQRRYRQRHGARLPHGHGKISIAGADFQHRNLRKTGGAPAKTGRFRDGCTKIGENPTR
jgi:hypothetical protein